MKSKISIWDCRRAIDIKGGLPLTMRGDLFDVDRLSAASVARWPPVKLLVTQLGVKQGQWIVENIVFTRSGQEHLTQAGARHHCGQRPLICLATIGPRRRGLGSQTTLTNPFPGSQRPVSGLPVPGLNPYQCQPARDRRNAANCLFSTGLCESGEFSTSIRVTSPARFFEHSGHPPRQFFEHSGHPNK